MIDAIGNATSLTSTSATATATAPSAGGFDAALEAARKAEQRRSAHADEVASIKTKGFTTWVRDSQIEALKEKLRKQVMAEMGVDDDSLSRLSAVMREILEKKIEEEVERRMQEAAREEQAKDGKGTQTASATQPPGKNDQDGKTCPVIPALSWPGAASLF